MPSATWGNPSRRPTAGPGSRNARKAGGLPLAWRRVRGAELLEEFGDRSMTTLLIEFLRLAARQRTYNIVVTNVPGPTRRLCAFR